jgi:hypothetical protein
MFKNMFSWVLFISCMIGLSALSCKDTEIPQTPEAPFALTRMWIMNDAQPPLGTVLTPGTNVTFDFQVAYTLTEEDANRSGLLLLVDFEVRDAANVAFELGDDPDGTLDLTSSSDIIQGTFTFTIPANAAVVDLFVEIQDSNGLLLQDARSWLVL